MPLCSDFLPVFEGEPYIVLTVDGYEIHESAPEWGIEFVHQVSSCEGGKEGFNRCLAGPLTVDGIFDRIEPCFGLICLSYKNKPIEEKMLSSMGFRFTYWEFSASCRCR